MKYLYVMIIAGLFSYSTRALAEYSILINDELRLDETLHQIPNAASYANLLTNVMSSSAYLLEESGGFSDIDPAKFSVHGDSWQHNDWHFNRFNISDSFFSGAPAFLVPFRMLDSVSIRNQGDATRAGGAGLVLRATGQQDNRVEFRGDIGKLGDIVPFAIDIMKAFSGLHIRKRGFAPPEERRHQPYNFRAQASERFTLFDTPTQAAFDYRQGVRQFLDFSPTTSEVSGTFDESFISATAGLGFFPARKKASDGQYDASNMDRVDNSEAVFMFVEHQQRDHLFAELHHSKAETTAYGANSIFVGYENERWNASATVKQFSLSHANHEFVREIFDPDGEALNPFIPDGDYLGTNLDFGFRADRIYASVNERLTYGRPEHANWSNPLNYKGQAYGQIDWSSKDNIQSVGRDKLGILDDVPFGDFRFNYDLYLAHHHTLNAELENTLSFFDAGLETALKWNASEHWQWFTSISKSPLPLTPELARTLDPNFLNGIHRLVDGRTINTTGGSSIDVGPSITPSNLYQAALGFTHKISPRWQLNTQALGRVFHQLYELRFKEDVNLNGYFVNNRFYLSEGNKEYLLSNTGEDISAYWGGQLQLYGFKPESYIFNLAFTVYSAIGYPVFGNGPTANDLAVVDASSANPNTNIHRLAILDGDRAYLFRLVMGKKLIDQLWGHLVISHRDGRPFSFFEDESDDGQVSLVNRSKRGSPLMFTRPLAGPREDFRLNIDASLRYGFELGGLAMQADLVARNLFDFGNEISERFTFPHNTERAGLEAEIPRSVLLTLRWVH
jgi:hypothetical protein